MCDVRRCAQEMGLCRGRKTSPRLSYEEETLIRQGGGTCQAAILTKQSNKSII